MRSSRPQPNDTRRRAARRPLPPAPDVAWARRRLLSWYSRHGRRLPWRTKDAGEYVQIVTEALLQRTRAETVAAFLPQFIQRFPSWSRLARATERQLEASLRPIGLWRRRARSLRGLSRAVTAIHGNWPTERQALESMPGVGQYVASAVLLFVHARPEPLLDTNMARVLERLFGARTMADIRHDPWLQALCRRVVSCRTPIAINWAVLDLAALVCTSRSPRCSECPLSPKCHYLAVSVSAKAKRPAPSRRDSNLGLRLNG